jgi:hypothetical protein
MAAKRVSRKSEDSFDEIFNDFYSKSVDLYKEIDNWSARINSLRTLDIRKAEFHFLDIFKFFKFFNFLTGEFDLLYHGKIVEPEGGQILRKIKGWLQSRLFPEKSSTKYEETNQNKFQKQRDHGR